MIMWFHGVIYAVNLFSHMRNIL